MPLSSMVSFSPKGPGGPSMAAAGRPSDPSRRAASGQERGCDMDRVLAAVIRIPARSRVTEKRPSMGRPRSRAGVAEVPRWGAARTLASPPGCVGDDRGTRMPPAIDRRTCLSGLAALALTMGPARAQTAPTPGGNARTGEAGRSDTLLVMEKGDRALSFYELASGRRTAGSSCPGNTRTNSSSTGPGPAPMPPSTAPSPRPRRGRGEMPSMSSILARGASPARSTARRSGACTASGSTRRTGCSC